MTDDDGLDHRERVAEALDRALDTHAATLRKLAAYEGVERKLSEMKLSELQALARSAVVTEESVARLARSVQQSMRVEGYVVSDAEVRESMLRILGATAAATPPK